jgi:hypothetical protein
MRFKTAIAFCLIAARAVAGDYAPAAGQPGSTAIAHNDPALIAWGSFNGQLTRGQKDISDVGGPLVTFGDPVEAAKRADAINESTLNDPAKVVSLGDGGSITLVFNDPIFDGPSWDFAVFENAFNDAFLELAFVEVFDGDTWARFPTHSQTPVHQSDRSGPTRRMMNLIPPTSTGLPESIGPASVHHSTSRFSRPRPGLISITLSVVRIVDVVGCIDPAFARRDSFGNIINEFWSTPFDFGGFDFDAVGAFHVIPEPATSAALIAGCICLGTSPEKIHRVKSRAFTLSNCS